jgi:hypothetical protein
MFNLQRKRAHTLVAGPRNVQALRREVEFLLRHGFGSFHDLPFDTGDLAITVEARVGAGYCPHPGISAASNKRVRICFIEVSADSCLAKPKNRIHLRRAPGWKITGQQRDYQQK